MNREQKESSKLNSVLIKIKEMPRYQKYGFFLMIPYSE